MVFILGIKWKKQVQFSAYIHGAEHAMYEVQVVPF